jgi:hypothetical protein
VNGFGAGEAVGDEIGKKAGSNSDIPGRQDVNRNNPSQNSREDILMNLINNGLEGIGYLFYR